MTPPSPPTIAGVEERSVPVAGRRMRYLTCGSGPPLVMLHGLLGYSFSWRFAYEALGQAATIYAPDALGAGFSDRDDGLDCSLAAFGQRSLEFMDALGLRDADLLGTSHGGAVAVFAAALDQEQGGKRIRRLVLVDAVNPWSTHGRRLIPFLAGPVGGLLPWAVRAFSWTHHYWLARQYADRSKIRPGTLAGYTLPLEVQGTVQHARRILGCWFRDLEGYEQKLAQVRHLPTLLLWGAADTSVPAASSAEIERRMVRAERVVLAGVGHLPYEEAPAEFNRVVLEFLQRTPK